MVREKCPLFEHRMKNTKKNIHSTCSIFGRRGAKSHKECSSRNPDNKYSSSASSHLHFTSAPIKCKARCLASLFTSICNGRILLFRGTTVEKRNLIVKNNGRNITEHKWQFHLITITTTTCTCSPFSAVHRMTLFSASLISLPSSWELSLCNPLTAEIKSRTYQPKREHDYFNRGENEGI